MPSAAAQKGVALTSNSRVFTIEDRAGPGHTPRYQALARPAAVSWAQGDVTPVRVPSSDKYGDFDVITILRGQKDLPTADLEFRKLQDISEVLKLVRKGCAFDVQVHNGVCGVPTDFDGGWSLIQVFEFAFATDYNTSDLGAFDADQNEVIMETMPIKAADYYEIKQISFTEQGASEVTDEISAIAIADKKTCGACGIASDGCQTAVAVAKATTGSPGLPTEVLYTSDGGATWASSVLTSATLTEAPTDIALIGTNVVVISGGSTDSLHYADLADLLAGIGSWTKVTSGIAGAGSPNKIFTFDPTHSWIVGDGGYIYFVADPTSGVSVQQSGSLTAQNLVDIHGIDEENLVAVGASNVVLYTNNGGDTWVSVTGPDVGVALNAVFVRSANEWLVGTAGGKLWYTQNKGTTWTQKPFPGHESGQIRDIQFSTPTVGYMAHDTAATPSVGRLLRTINGGNTWYALPEGPGSFNANRRINSIAACRDDVNAVYAAGLGNGATDGIILKGA